MPNRASTDVFGLKLGLVSRGRSFAIASTILACLAAAGCAAHPLQFAERPPIIDARDEQPIPVPARRPIPDAVYVSEVYLHRPVRNALDLSPYPESGDVNSMDEVVYSSWFDPHPADLGVLARGPASEGPPLPPYTLAEGTPTTLRFGFRIVDARGLQYEVGIDPPDRPELRTAAAAISARLLWAMGWRTPPSFVLGMRAQEFSNAGQRAEALAKLSSGPPAIGGYYRVCAVRWPPGLWIGQTAEQGRAHDDPNDAIVHENRRTLRTLQVVGAWLRLHDFGPRNTLDVYEGPRGQGHLVHYVAGLDETLGAGDLVRSTDPAPGEGGGGPGMRLLTLGLLPNPAPPPTQTELPALGEIEDEFDVRDWSGPPYAPVERILASDGYWAVKRIAAVSSAALAASIAAGRFSDERAQRRLLFALERRKDKLMRYWYRQVTPLEFVSATQDAIVLRDEAIGRTLAGVAESAYEINFFDLDGTSVSPTMTLVPHIERFTLTLPTAARAVARNYLILRVFGRRSGSWLPRAFEIHIKLTPSGVQVLGIRH